MHATLSSLEGKQDILHDLAGCSRQLLEELNLLISANQPQQQCRRLWQQLSLAFVTNIALVTHFEMN